GEESEMGERRDAPLARTDPGAGCPPRLRCAKQSVKGGTMMRSSRRRALLRLMAILAIAAAAALVGSLPAAAQSGNPIRIGYGMSQTGGLAPNGKSALLA